MTFPEFLKRTYAFLKGADGLWVPESYLKPETHERQGDERFDNGLTFSETWCMGGTRGWYGQGEDGPEPADVQAEPEDPVAFDLILENMAPNLTFMQYKGIRREVMERFERGHSDYYGGSTTEGHKGFKVKALYEALNKRGILP